MQTHGPDDMEQESYPDKFINTYVGYVYGNNIPGWHIAQMGEVGKTMWAIWNRRATRVNGSTSAIVAESISVGVEYFIERLCRTVCARPRPLQLDSVVDQGAAGLMKINVKPPHVTITLKNGRVKYEDLTKKTWLMPTMVDRATRRLG